MRLGPRTPAASDDFVTFLAAATELQNIRAAIAAFNSGGLGTSCVQYVEITQAQTAPGLHGDYVVISSMYNTG